MALRTKTYQFVVFEFADTYSLSLDLERITTFENNLSALLDVVGQEGIIYGLEASYNGNSIEVSPGLAIIKNDTGYLGLRLDAPAIIEFDSINEKTAIFLTRNGIVSYENALAPLKTYPDYDGISLDNAGLQWGIVSSYSFGNFDLFFDIVNNTRVDRSLYEKVSDEIIEFSNRLPVDTPLSALVKPENSIFIAFVTTTATEVTSIDTSLRKSITSPSGNRVPEHTHSGSKTSDGNLTAPEKINLTSITKRVAGTSEGNDSTAFLLDDFQAYGHEFVISSQESVQLSGKIISYDGDISDDWYYAYILGHDEPYEIASSADGLITLKTSTYKSGPADAVFTNCLIHPYADGTEMSSGAWSLESDGESFSIITDVNFAAEITCSLEIAQAEQEIDGRLPSDMFEANAESLVTGIIKPEHIPALSHDGFVELLPSELTRAASVKGGAMKSFRLPETLGCIDCVSAPWADGRVYVSCEHGIVPIELNNGNITQGQPILDEAFISDRTTRPFKFVVVDNVMYAVSEYYVLRKTQVQDWSVFINLTDNDATSANILSDYESSIIYDCEADHRGNFYLSTDTGIVFMDIGGSWRMLTTLGAKAMAITEDYIAGSGKILCGDGNGIGYFKSLPMEFEREGTTSFSLARASDFSLFQVSDTIYFLEKEAITSVTVTALDTADKIVTVSASIPTGAGRVARDFSEWTSIGCNDRGIVTFGDDGDSLIGSSQKRTKLTIAFTDNTLCSEDDVLDTVYSVHAATVLGAVSTNNGGRVVISAGESYVYDFGLAAWALLTASELPADVTFAFGLNNYWYLGQYTGLIASNGTANGQANAWVPCFTPMGRAVESTGSVFHKNGIAKCTAGLKDTSVDHWDPLLMTLSVTGNLDNVSVGNWLYVTKTGGGNNVEKRYRILSKAQASSGNRYQWTIEIESQDGDINDLNFAWGETFLIESAQGVYSNIDDYTLNFSKQAITFTEPVNQDVDIAVNFTEFSIPARGDINAGQFYYNGREIGTITGTIKEVSGAVLVVGSPIFYGLDLSGKIATINGKEYEILKTKADVVTLKTTPIADIGHEIAVSVVEVSGERAVLPSELAWAAGCFTAKIPDYYITNG